MNLENTDRIEILRIMALLEKYGIKSAADLEEILDAYFNLQ